jgi:hypothetical protein
MREMSLRQVMSDSDPKTGPGGAIEVSEAEVEAYPEGAEPGIEAEPSASTQGGAAAGLEDVGSAPPRPGAAPPPLPRRRRFPRPKPVHIIGFLVLCTVLGLGIGLFWNLVIAPGAEQASPATERAPVPAGHPPAAVEIRLDEMVVTSDEENGEESREKGSSDNRTGQPNQR